MDRGYVRLWRKVRDSAIIEDGPMCQIFFKALVDAAYSPHRKKVGRQFVDLLPGQFVFGRNQWSRELHLSPKVIRNRITMLEKRDSIKAIHRANEFTVYCFVNWEVYASQEQEEGQPEGQPKGQPRANHGPHLKKGRREEKKKSKSSASASPDAGNEGEFFLTKKGRKLTGPRLTTFLRFWEAFAYKKGKAEAADSWLDIPTLTERVVKRIVLAAQAEAERRPELIAKGSTPKMAQGWLTARRWEDEDALAGLPESAGPALPPEEIRRQEFAAMSEEMRVDLAKRYTDVLTTEERQRYGVAS